MNGVSVIILLIGMMENIAWYVNVVWGWALIFFIVAFLVMSVSKIIDLIIANDDATRRAEGQEKGLISFTPFLDYGKAILKYSGVVMVLCIILGTVAIDKKYMIMIAASEVGEMVVESEAVQSAAGEIGDLSRSTMGLLKKYIEVETLKIQEEINAEIEKHLPKKEEPGEKV